jgi:hypothetical protein
MNIISEIKNNFICVFLGHVISNEDRQFINRSDAILHSMCPRCKYPLLVWKKTKGKKEDIYYLED